MNTQVTVAGDGETITIHIPMTFRKRGKRKMVVTPEGAPWAPRPRIDSALVKALARAFRWQGMLDRGVCATIEELAQRERVNRGYMSRVLRLTLLNPDLVETILDGRQPAELQLDDLLEEFPFGMGGGRPLRQRSSSASATGWTSIAPRSALGDWPDAKYSKFRRTTPPRPD